MKTCIPLLLLLTVSCSSPQPIDLLVIGGQVVDLDGDAAPKVRDIAILEGRIVAIGHDLAGSYKPGEVLDATGRFIVPGLADMHSHFGNGILPPGEDDSTQVLARHLYYGNTTILNLGSFQASPERIDALRADMESGALEGPRLLAVGSLITRVGSHPSTTIYSPPVQARIAERVATAPATGPIDLMPIRATTLVRTPDDVTTEVRRVGEWGADAIKITVESGPGHFAPKPRMTPEMIAAAVAAAEPFGIPVLCHISEVEELLDCLEQGAQGAVHGVVREAELPADFESRLVEAGFVVIPTAAMFDGWNRYTANPALLDDPFLAQTISERERALFSSPEMIERMSEDGFEKAVQKLGEHIDRYHNLGGRLIAGTDTGNPYRFAGYALHEELAFYVAAGLTEREALRTATVEAARLVGAEDRWGSIREGLAADLLVLDKNPLVAIENTRSITEVIRNGKRVDRAGLPVR